MRWPSVTIGRWLIEVPWFERVNLPSAYVVYSPSSSATVINSADTSVTAPALVARTMSPAS